MKKYLALLLALAMVFALCACGQAAAPAPAAPAAEAPAAEAPAAEGPAKIGISMPTKSLERWNRDGSYLKEQFEAAGYEVELTYSDNDAVQQNNDIANMIADGVKVLIISAIDSDSLSQTLADAEAADIYVIAYDRLINNAKTAYYVSFDNYTVGVLQAEYVIKALDLENAGDKKFNIEFTAGDPADTNAGYFFSGAKDTLQKYLDAGTLNVVSGQIEFEQVATAQWSTDNALNRMQNVLASYYSDGTVLDVALCSNDSTALGVAQAITSDYVGNAPVITGQDGDIANLKNIVDGVQTMTVYKNVAQEAGVTLVVVKAILEGKTPDASLCAEFGDIEAKFDTETYDNGLGVVPSYLLVPYSIDKENLDLLVDTGLYTMGADGYLAAK